VDRLAVVLFFDAALLVAFAVDALPDRRAFLGELPFGKARSIALPALVATPLTALPALTAAPPTALPALVAALPTALPALDPATVSAALPTALPALDPATVSAALDTALPALDPATVSAALPTVSAALPTVFPTFLPTSLRTLPLSAILSSSSAGLWAVAISVHPPCPSRSCALVSGRSAPMELAK
jgi:hypothetical protein